MPMKDRAFIDTNVLIYLYSEDEPEKRESSKNIFFRYHCVTNTQVLNELLNIMIKKFKISLPEALEVINEVIGNCEINLIGIYTIKKALAISEKYKYSYYDSLIVASALENKCKLLITEDMQNRQVIDGYLTIMNIYQSQ
jgi:predicted nucleic acid-binding protein